MPKGIYKNKQCVLTKIPNFEPNPHQIAVKDFVLNSTFKGLLIYHKLGSGKTCTSIITANALLNEGKIKHVFICTPGSLRTNWLYEYCHTCGIGTENLRKNFTFITYNYDISTQLEQENFNNSLVIVDEFHNVINGVKNETKTFVNLYEKIDSANCKVLLLSGTPIIKDPESEWGFILKLLDPNSFLNKTNIKDLAGLVSYYETDSSLYPTVYNKDPIKVLMTEPQQERFYKAHSFEEGKRLNGMPKREKFETEEEFKKEKAIYILACKYFLTRRVSNFYYPEEITQAPDILSTEKSSNLPLTVEQQAAELELVQIMEADPDINIADLPKPKPKPKLGWVSNETLGDKRLLKLYSPKFTSLILNILLHPNCKHMVYSIYKIKGGVVLFNTLLNKCGIKSAIFSGDLNDGERLRLLSKFNSPENRNGEKIQVILLTEAGEQGITLLEVNNVHILESGGHNFKIQQAIGRAARFKSHVNLPEDRNYVNVWRYWSSISHGISFEPLPGIDEILYNKAKVRQDTINTFNEEIQKISI
jgi:superfamily II DNA or RNA helicase